MADKMPTPAQKGANARAALDAAMTYYKNGVPGKTVPEQLTFVKSVATTLANWLDSRTQ